MKYWSPITFPTVKHSGSPLLFPDLVYLGAYWLVVQVFFTPRNGTILPCKAFTLQCQAVAFPDWLLDAGSCGENPPQFSFGEIVVRLQSK